jgi:probable HAF family extracellular repeat protein
MMNKKLFFTILVSVFLVGRANATTYSYKTINFPGASNTQLFGINARGQVIGKFEDNLDGTPTTFHAFLYSGGTFTDIDILEHGRCLPPQVGLCAYHLLSTPRSINDNGQVLISYVNRIIGPNGDVYSNGTHTAIGISFPLDINNKGQVVGFSFHWSTLYSGGVYTSIRHPNTITGSGYTFANGINASGQVAGTYTEGNPINGVDITHGFILSEGVYTTVDVPNAISTYVAGINTSGQVAGYYTDASGRKHGFLYSGGAFKTFDVPGFIDSTFPYQNFQINDKGQVSGTYTDVSGNEHGFVYVSGAVTTIDIPNATTTFVNGINAKGQLAGYYTNGTGVHGFIATPALSPPSKKDCLKGGWKKFGFKSQGRCIRFVKKRGHKGKDEEHHH